MPTSSYANSSTGGHTSSHGALWSSPAFQMRGLSRDSSGHHRYVFLCVYRRGQYRLAQMLVTNLQDDAFFDQLREYYQKFRGFWRKHFSMWIYSHCEFRRVGLSTTASAYRRLTLMLVRKHRAHGTRTVTSRASARGTSALRLVPLHTTVTRRLPSSADW